MTNFTQQTSDLALTGLRDGVPVDAIDALLLSVRDLGAVSPTIHVRTESKGMSGCSPCVTTTTTSISFSFQSAKDECPPGPPACAESVDSLEYVDPPSETSSRPESPARPQSPALATAIGAPGLTAAAGQRWFAVTKGRSVGVFQGSVTIEPFVKGVSGNRSVGYATRELANLAFASAVRANEVAILD